MLALWFGECILLMVAVLANLLVYHSVSLRLFLTLSGRS